MNGTSLKTCCMRSTLSLVQLENAFSIVYRVYITIIKELSGNEREPLNIFIICSI